MNTLNNIQFNCKVRSSYQGVFYKKGFLRHFTKFKGKHLCQRLFFNKVFSCEIFERACNFNKKEALTQVLSCEFCEISNNTFLHRITLVTASVSCRRIRRNALLHIAYHHRALEVSQIFVAQIFCLIFKWIYFLKQPQTVAFVLLYY